jgi:phage-related protein
MAKSNQIAAIILGAAAGVALVKFFSMPKEEREEFCSHLKNQTTQLLDNAEDTVEKVEQYIDELKAQGEDEWIDKIYILKKMFRSLYGSDRHYFL